MDDQESHNSLQQQQEHDRRQLVKGGKGKGKDKGEAYNPRLQLAKAREATPASEKVPMVRNLLEDRAHDPSLLVESRQPAARTAAPTATSLVPTQLGAANDYANLQHRPACSLHRNGTRQQPSVELRAFISSLDTASFPSPSAQHRPAREPFKSFLFGSSLGHTCDTGAATSVAPPSFASYSELSPAPSALKLSTATGKALKIYGLRQVHLRSSEPRFELAS